MPSLLSCPRLPAVTLGGIFPLARSQAIAGTQNQTSSTFPHSGPAPYRPVAGEHWEPSQGPMESETGSREAGLAPASCPYFMLEWRIQAAGACRDIGTPRDEGTPQSLGVGTVEEPVHEARAGRETEQAPLVVELVLAVEDTMVVVEVVYGAVADNREEAEEEGQREEESQVVEEEEECEHEEDLGEESEEGTQFEVDDEEADEETGTDDEEETEDDRSEVDDESEQDDEEDVAMAHEEEGEAEEEPVMSEMLYMVEEQANLQEEEDKMEEGQGEEDARKRKTPGSCKISSKGQSIQRQGRVHWSPCQRLSRCSGQT